MRIFFAVLHIPERKGQHAGQLRAVDFLMACTQSFISFLKANLEEFLIRLEIDCKNREKNYYCRAKAGCYSCHICLYQLAILRILFLTIDLQIVLLT